MVSEEVTIDVQIYHGSTIVLYDDESIQERLDEPIYSYVISMLTLTEGNLAGHVTASFIMQNQGDAPESFDVWFPIGASDGGYYGAVTVANFQAWVNGSLVETGRRETEDHGESLPWATWPVDFPVGEPVQLTVAYDLAPNYVHPLLIFDYILETGSGWWGVIGAGTFTFKLPYEITEENTSLYTGNLGDIPLGELAVSGDEMRWTFSNLEPDRGDNVTLAMIGPAVWAEILAARAGVDANPDSVESQICLAHTLVEAMGTHHGIISEQQLIPEAVQAYEEALALAPDDIELYIDYIEFLYLVSQPIGPIPGQLEPTLRRALEIAPDDERLLAWEEEFREFEQEIEQREARYATQTARPPKTPTAPPEATPTPTLTLTQTPPASTPTVDAAADVPPQPPQGSGGFPSWVVIAGLAMFLFALAVVFRGQAGYDESGPGL